MLYLVCYDVENTKIRTKVAKALEKLGLCRIQYSVFIGLLSEAERQALETKVRLLLEKDPNYSFVVVPLHNDMVESITEISKHPLDWEYLNGTKLCMVI